MAKKTERHGTCSLVLTISTNNVSSDYRVRLVRFDKGVKTYRLTKLDGDESYETGYNGNNDHCTCPDWQKRKPNGGCKHIRALRVHGMI